MSATMTQPFPPLIGAVALLLGTGTAVAVDVRHRRILERERERTDAQQQQQMDNSAVHVDVDKPTKTTSGIANGTIGNSSHDPSQQQQNQQQTVTLRLPTVSVATKRFGSAPYIIFVITALVYGSAFLWTTFLLRRDVTTQCQEPCNLFGTLLLSAASFGAPSIVLTSLIPATGRGTAPHVACGMAWFSSAIVWMIWATQLTRYSIIRANNNNVSVLDDNAMSRTWVLYWTRIVLVSVANIVQVIAGTYVWKTMKVEKRGTEGWRRTMHLAACGQLVFGILHSVYLATMAL